MTDTDTKFDTLKFVENNIIFHLMPKMLPLFINAYNQDFFTEKNAYYVYVNYFLLLFQLTIYEVESNK